MHYYRQLHKTSKQGHVCKKCKNTWIGDSSTCPTCQFEDQIKSKIKSLNLKLRYLESIYEKHKTIMIFEIAPSNRLTIHISSGLETMYTLYLGGTPRSSFGTIQRLTDHIQKLLSGGQNEFPK